MRDLDEVFGLRKPEWKPKTLSAYTVHFFKFAQWYCDNGRPNMDMRDALNFLNSITAKKRSATTRNAYRNTLKSLFGDLTKLFKERYPNNPFAEVKKLQESRKTKDWFRPQQLEKLIPILSKEDPELFLACKIMFHCFIRPNEIRQLQICAINFETKKFCVESTIAKTSRTRYVNIPAELLNDLEFLKGFDNACFIFSENSKPGTTAVGRDVLSKRHEKFMKKLNFSKRFTFYSWKNTGAVKMLMMDRKPMRYVSKCMGHSSMDMTDKYFQSLGVDEMEGTIVFPSLLPKSKQMSSNALPVCTFQIRSYSHQ